MNILLTGATGYIGKRLLPILVKNGHHVVCCVRDKTRFNPPGSLKKNISILEADIADPSWADELNIKIDVAYYLIHSMSTSDDYLTLEEKCAKNFQEGLANRPIEQVIYLSGIVNESSLSKHLQSRKNVENELAKGNYHLTTFRAGIILGSGSASFEIIRDLVEKLPFMITPKWLHTKCQPIAISDVMEFLSKSIGNEKTYDQNFDIGSSDIMSYKEMLLGFAEERGLKRYIITVPIMTPRLSSYWLYFVTSTSYKLAKSLVDSMKIEVICRESNINEIIDISPISYKEALKKAFDKIESNDIASSWKDSYVSSGTDLNISEFIEVPKFGCFKDKRTRGFRSKKDTINKIWSIGGDTGWYYGNWLWKLRGYIDKLFGGVGLRRGRTNRTNISAGDALDFWRVLYANKEEGKLLLFAEMKVPGEAWLSFNIEGNKVTQTATFRPKGIMGRLYWWSVVPLHGPIFRGLIRKLAE